MKWVEKTSELFNNIFLWLTKDRSKTLPYYKVQIGEHKTETLCCGINVTIKLNENTRPPIDEFLKRITFAKPYCPKCGIELSLIYNSGVDVFQIGYKCENCNTKIKCTEKELRRILHSLVRKIYNKAWEKYKEEIKKMTNGKEKKFKVY